MRIDNESLDFEFALRRMYMDYYVEVLYNSANRPRGILEYPRFHPETEIEQVMRIFRQTGHLLIKNPTRDRYEVRPMSFDKWKEWKFGPSEEFRKKEVFDMSALRRYPLTPDECFPGKMIGPDPTGPSYVLP